MITNIIFILCLVYTLVWGFGVLIAKVYVARNPSYYIKIDKAGIVAYSVALFIVVFHILHMMGL